MQVVRIIYLSKIHLLPFRLLIFKNGLQGLKKGVQELKSISVKEIFFGDRILSAHRHPQNIDSYSADFKDEARQDIVMDGDAIKESQNTPPEKSPFSLEKNEAILSYTIKGEMHYYKISNLEEKPLIAYPSSNPNGRN